jgi:hypothetical protein
MTSYAAPVATAISNVDRMMSRRRSMRPGRPKPMGAKPGIVTQDGKQGIMGRGGNLQPLGAAATRRVAAGQELPQLQDRPAMPLGASVGPPAPPAGGPPIAIDGMPPPPGAMADPMLKPGGATMARMDGGGFGAATGVPGLDFNQLPPEIMARISALRGGGPPPVGPSGPPGVPPGLPPGAQVGPTPQQERPGLDAYWRMQNARGF